MKKKLLTIIFACIALLALTGCQSHDEDSGSSSEKTDQSKKSQDDSDKTKKSDDDDDSDTDDDYYDDDDEDEDTDDDDDSEEEDPKLLGVFIGLLKSPDWFKDNLKEGHMYFSDDEGHAKFAGFDCITANGDPASYFWFKQDGDEVVVKYSDPDHVVADGVYKTERIAISRLKKDYYVNDGQKQEVDGYVNKLKSLDDAD